MSPSNPDHNVRVAQGKTQLATFKDDLTRAILGAYPTPERITPYHRVRVALVHWDVDINAQKSVMEMGHTFQVYYGYECSRFALEARSATYTPEQSLQRICIQIGYAGRKGDLTIFYYAGHSIWDPRFGVLRFQSGSYSLTEKNSSIPKMARASADFTTQSRANLDKISASAVLYLLDTGVYAPGRPAITDTERELFAAMKIDPILTATTNSDSDNDNDNDGNDNYGSDDYGNGNWTQKLCGHLRVASRRNEPMTVAQLCSKMIQSILEADEAEVADFPVHSGLMPSMEGRSIVLAPESARKWTGFGELPKPHNDSDSGSDPAPPEVLIDKNDGPLKVKPQVHERKHKPEHELPHPQAQSRPMAVISVHLDFQPPKIAGEKPQPPLSAPAIFEMIEDFRAWFFAFINTTYYTTREDLPLLTPWSLAKIVFSRHYLRVFAAGNSQCLFCHKLEATAGSRKNTKSGVVVTILLPVEVWLCMGADPAYEVNDYVMTVTK